MCRGFGFVLVVAVNVFGSILLCCYVAGFGFGTVVAVMVLVRFCCVVRLL